MSGTRGTARVVRSGVGRRRVQTLVIGLATMIAVTASVLGGTLLVASTAPYDTAFTEQHGAHLTVHFDAGRTTTAKLSESTHLAGVTATAGPFRTALITPQADASGRKPPPMTVVGRAEPGGPVDAVPLVQGRWVTGPGEIVLSADYPLGPDALGAVLRVTELPGSPSLTVVGIARSVTHTADGWVAPAQIPGLTAPGAPGGDSQLLYRFAAAGTDAEVTAHQAVVVAVIGAEAVTGTRSWLTVKRAADRDTALYLPFLIAFGLLGLVMSVLIVGNVVAGAVSAGTRRIGILKALGFTPAQVVRAYMIQALIPAAAGTAVGVVAGNLLAIPVLADADQLYGTTSAGVAPWIAVTVVAGALGVVAVTAWAAALRAGRLRTVEAITVGRTPRPGRGQWTGRLTARLPLPRPISLGLAHPFARPVRAAAMLAAIVFGATAVTFAVGMASSLNRVQVAKDHATADVLVDPLGPPAGGGPVSDIPKEPTADQLATIAAAIAGQPGTGRYYSLATTELAVAGMTGSVRVSAFTGDASWGGYEMVSGRWFSRPGEAVVPSTFLADTGTRVGDTVVLTNHGREVPVRIVGEVFHPTNILLVFTDVTTLVVAEPEFANRSYHIAVTPGTDVTGYIAGLNDKLGPLGFTAQSGEASGGSGTIIILNSLTALLTLLLVAVAAMGVLNMVVLDTRERVRDLGVYKALGMTPRQTITMVVASVVVIGLVGGLVGVAAGVALHRVVVPAMGSSSGIAMPASIIDVYRWLELVPLGLGGLLIAVLGALLPAGWAARTRTATAIRAE